ncbi:hypothetical protein ENBRE01_0058 [Enteropsectra breve]|nr:hypothetical protein ENBRE01_0058 [Enteropsectra breve]
MTESEITKRLAMTDINTDIVTLPWIFKIVEGVSDKCAIKEIKSYVSKTGAVYCILEFADAESAKSIYNLCDGIEIEQTGEYFNLSFVPEGMEFANEIEKCSTAAHFDYNAHVGRIKCYGDMLEISDEDLDAAIEKKLSDAKETKKAPEAPSEIAKELSAKSSDREFQGFEFNPRDPRFAKIFSDPAYFIDASHKKFKECKELADIIEIYRKENKDD